MSYLEKIVYLTKQDYETLSNNGTVGSLTGINDDYLYFITNETASISDLTDDYILPVKNGGTGKNSFTIGSLLVGNGQNALTEIGATDQNTFNTIVKRDSNGGFSMGLLKIISSGNTTTIGSQNSGWCHIYNSSNWPFIFNNSVAVTGGASSTATLGTTSYPFHQLILGGATNATMTSSSTNPRITFQEKTGTQPVHLVYTDLDSYRNPAGLKVVGGADANPAWFEAEGSIFANGGNRVPHTGNTTGTIGGTTTPVYVDGGQIKALSYTIAQSVPADAVFTDHYAWGDITGKPTKITLTGAVTGNVTLSSGENSIATTVNHNHDDRYKIASGVITLGSNTITPVTSVNGHQGASVNVTASDLGLASALKYVGTKSSLPTATDSTTYSAYNNGDVITVSNKEYAYVKGSNAAGSSWVELGDEGSYKLRQTAFTNSTGTADGSNTSITFIYSFSQDENGTITNIKTRSLPTATSTDAGIVKVGASGGAAAYSHTHSYLANTNIGAADRPIYITGNAAAQTTYRMAGTNTTATTGITYSGDLDTGIWYVNGISGTDKTTLYNQSDGVIIANKYSTSWISEIYQDYRTGQLAIRGKNNGTWAAWRKILDSTNYTDYAVAKTAGVTAVTWDATNKKLTSTINGTDAEVMTAAQISTALELGTIASKAEDSYMKFGGDDTNLGSGSPASNAKTYWADTTKVSDNMITGYYNHSGTEYSLLFSKRSTYGSILKWGYSDKYLRILRVQGGSWKSTDWEKIDAGYADSAGTATSAGKWTTACNISISDSDGTNTGTAVSVDGSEAVTLKLPATIKADLTGNASTVTSTAGTSTLAWGSEVTLYTVGGAAIKAKLPSNPNSDHYTSAWCDTAAGTQAKAAYCTNYTLTANTWLHVLIKNANTYNGKITLNVNSTGAKDIWINGAVSSSTNKTLPAGTYLIYYDGTKYQFRTDGQLPGNISGSAGSVAWDNVSGHPTNLSQFTNDSGYVTSSGVSSITIKTTSPITGGSDTATTSTGEYTIAHATGDGNLHVPATGTTNNGKVLKAGSTAGSISWGTLSASDVGAAPSSTVSCTTANVKTALGTGSGTTKFLREDGTWQTPAYTTNTDEKLKIAAVTSGTIYYPIVAANSTAAANRQYDATGFAYLGTNGTTSTVGVAKITLGNSTASGTANNKQGSIGLYGSTAYLTTIISGAPTAANTLTLPTATGTFALTSDLPTTVSKTAAGLCPILPNETTTTKFLCQDGNWVVPSYIPDTHHTAYLRAGAANGTANAATTTGNTYLLLVENSTHRSGVKLVPGSNMSITSDASGNVTFTSSYTNTLNTAGSTDSTSKLYLIGATSQAANPQTYSDSHVFETNGAFSAKTLGVNADTDNDKVTLQWNSTDSSLDFVFA